MSSLAAVYWRVNVSSHSWNASLSQWMFTALQHEAEAGTEAFLPTLLLFIPALLMGTYTTAIAGGLQSPQEKSIKKKNKDGTSAITDSSKQRSHRSEYSWIKG